VPQVNFVRTRLTAQAAVLATSPDLLQLMRELQVGPGMRGQTDSLWFDQSSGAGTLPKTLSANNHETNRMQVGPIGMQNSMFGPYLLRRGATARPWPGRARRPVAQRHSRRRQKLCCAHRRAASARRVPRTSGARPPPGHAACSPASTTATTTTTDWACRNRRREAARAAVVPCKIISAVSF
jgi:hypothetical protein